VFRSQLAIEGFDYATVVVGRSRYLVGVAGGGPPVLLLHGFPKDQYCWQSCPSNSSCPCDGFSPHV